jgi:hypothetical protein
MRRALAAALLPVCFLLSIRICGAQSPSAWKEFSSRQAGFSVRVPGTLVEQPPPKKQSSSAPVTHSFVLNDKDSAYIISYTDYSRDQLTANPATVLTAARNGGIQNVKGQLVAETVTKVSGYPARDVIAAVPLENKQGSAHFRIVLARSRLYMALYVGPGGSAGQARVEVFLKSFRILHAAASARIKKRVR